MTAFDPIFWVCIGVKLAGLQAPAANVDGSDITTPHLLS